MKNLQMKKNIIKMGVMTGILLIAAIKMSPAVFAAEAVDDLEKRVLFLSAYSYSYESVPKQIEGIETELGEDFILNYEFMDTKNTAYSENYKEFYELLKFKMEEREPYDAIIAADDAALCFAQEYQNELFFETPIIFEGIGNVENTTVAVENPWITGVVELIDYKANLELAQKVMPDATKIVFLLDHSDNGMEIREQLETVEDLFSKYDIEYIDSSEYTKKQLEERLQKLEQGSIVFALSMSQRKDGTIYTEAERYHILEKYVKVPLFRVSSSGMDSCDVFLGGYVVSHLECGKIAAIMLKEALLENDIASIPVDYNTPHEYYFNWAVIREFNLNRMAFPQDAVYINEDPSFLSIHYMEILAYLAVVIMLLLLILFIGSLHGRRKQIVLNQRLDAINEELNCQNKELEKKNQELIKVSAYKTDFLSRVSHDIRTPMNTIMNLTKMLEEELDDQKLLKEDLHKIEIANQFLLTLVNDILDVSRIEQKKIELHEQRYSYCEFLDYIRSTFEPLANQKSIELTLTKGSQDVDIIIDKSRFNQLCFNLLSNAIKYTPVGGHVQFRMKHGAITDGKLHCEIDIVDDGIGMSKDFIDRMYEPFAQEGRNYETVEGTGLGLSIVKEIAELLGVVISVKSEINKGTIFHMEMEMKIAQGEIETKDYSIADQSLLTGKRLLVAEDHILNQEIMKRLLEKAGIIVTVRNNGQETLEEFSQHPEQYDAILMDLRMPVMDGVTATKEIRKLENERAAQIPIIAMTANALSEDRENTKAAGMNAHLAKPVDPQELYHTLIELICA